MLLIIPLTSIVNMVYTGVYNIHVVYRAEEPSPYEKLNFNGGLFSSTFSFDAILPAEMNP